MPYSIAPFPPLKHAPCLAMVNSELRTEIWVQALLRTAQANGAMGYVVRRGDSDGGAVLVKISRLNGTARLLVPARNGDGQRIYLDLTGKTAGPDEASIDAYLAKRANQDRDIWSVEIEDRDGRSFLTERIDEG
jgi:hypothetical protein